MANKTQLVATLSDSSLAAPIEWEVSNLTEAKAPLRFIGAWQGDPVTGNAILLSDGAEVLVGPKGKAPTHLLKADADGKIVTEKL